MATLLVARDGGEDGPAARPEAWWYLPLQARITFWQRSRYWSRISAEQLYAHSLFSRFRVVQAAGGERAGKSRFSAEEGLTWIGALLPFAEANVRAGERRGGLIWLAGPDYEQAREEFSHLKTALARNNLLDEAAGVSEPKSGAWQMFARAGIEIRTRSSKHEDTLAGVPPDGVVMCEAAQHSLEAFRRLRGRLLETRGPLLLSGTFEGSLNWYADLWQDLQSDNLWSGRSVSIPTWANRTVCPGGRNDPEILALEAVLDQETFDERYGAIPHKPATLVFREFSEPTHVTEAAKFDPHLPVQLWIDPGYDHPYAVLAVQKHGRFIDHVDELWLRGLTGREVIAQAQAREWWPNVHTLVMDVAGRQHHSDDSQAEIWRALTGLSVISNDVPILAGINRHRQALKMDPAQGRPGIRHNPRCAGTISEYRKYKRPEDKDGRPVTELPIDRDNDAMKAIAYGLWANFGALDGDGRQRKPREAKITFRAS